MRPFAMIAGILLGSSLAISVGLAVVLLLFVLLGPDYPQLAVEWPALRQAALIFTGLTGLCAIGFVGQVKTLWWRHLAFILELGAVALVAVFYWP